MHGGRAAVGNLESSLCDPFWWAGARLRSLAPRYFSIAANGFAEVEQQDGNLRPGRVLSHGKPLVAWGLASRKIGASQTLIRRVTRPLACQGSRQNSQFLIR